MPRTGSGTRLKRQRQSTLVQRWKTSMVSMLGTEGTYGRPAMNSALVLDVPNCGEERKVSNGFCRNWDLGGSSDIPRNWSASQRSGSGPHSCLRGCGWRELASHEG